jgi:hypothetical protein
MVDLIIVAKIFLSRDRPRLSFSPVKVGGVLPPLTPRKWWRYSKSTFIRKKTGMKIKSNVNAGLIIVV